MTILLFLQTQKTISNGFLEKPLIPETIITDTSQTSGSYLDITKQIAGSNWKLVYAIGVIESGYNSQLCRNQNNCWGRKTAKGTWASYPTFSDGVQDEVQYLQRKYFDLGLTTPYQISPKYCENCPSWAGNVQKVINSL